MVSTFWGYYITPAGIFQSGKFGLSLRSQSRRNWDAAREAVLRTAVGNTLKFYNHMKTIPVKAIKRDAFGKKAAKAIRREGLTPCVLCGNGETVAFTVDPREVKPLIYTPSSYIVEFDFDGKKELAVLREAQFHPVREEILHLDFYRIAAGKPVSIAIPVRLTGNAEGVKVGGKLTLSARKLTVSALVENLPDEIVVDVTNLGVGKTIFVGDLQFENLKFVTPATAAVCAVRVTRASRGAEAAAK